MLRGCRDPPRRDKHPLSHILSAVRLRCRSMGQGRGRCAVLGGRAGERSGGCCLPGWKGHTAAAVSVLAGASLSRTSLQPERQLVSACASGSTGNSSAVIAGGRNEDEKLLRVIALRWWLAPGSAPEAQALCSALQAHFPGLGCGPQQSQHLSWSNWR